MCLVELVDCNLPWHGYGGEGRSLSLSPSLPLSLSPHPRACRGRRCRNELTGMPLRSTDTQNAPPRDRWRLAGAAEVPAKVMAGERPDNQLTRADDAGACARACVCVWGGGGGSESGCHWCAVLAIGRRL
jgi:hypothetical protein